MTIKVKHNQSLFDIAIQVYGTIEGIVEIAVANGLSITGELIQGQLLQIPDYSDTKIEVVKYFSERKLTPATGSTLIEQTTIPTPPISSGCSWTLIEW